MTTRRNPFTEIEELFERMSRQFEETELPMRSGLESMSVDVADRDDEFVVTADLPGFEKEDIDLMLSGDRLRINARRETEEETEEEGDGSQYIRQERRRKSMSRSVELPEPVDESETTATYQNGVLTVELPKREVGDESRRIDIG